MQVSYITRKKYTNKKISKKYIISFLLIIIYISFSSYIKIYINKPNGYSNIKPFENGIIKENFFIIDSNNLDKIQSHMYGFSISRNGILTDNYYKLIGYYEEPEPEGVYIMIRKSKNEIKIIQDFHGNFGLYMYRDHYNDYFAISNSFLLIEQYLSKIRNISLNKDYANDFVASVLYTPTIYETLIKEIIKVSSNAFIVINLESKKYKIHYIDYKEHTIPLETEEGLKIIDEWVDKWGYIIRSLKKKTDNISTDLSGGFDTRVILSIFLNSGINLNNILISSSKTLCHEEDLKIATNISKKFGFKINNYNLDQKGTEWSTKDTLFCSMYSKLGFHKDFYLKDKFFQKPRFSFHGGGEIRGYPSLPINNYILKISSQSRNIGNIFYKSSKRICDRSISILKKSKTYYNDYEISSDFYTKGRSVHHDGKAALEAFISNIYMIQPMIDSDIKKIKFDMNCNSTHDLVAYVYTRFAKEIISFPFQGNRSLNLESIKKAERLNKLISPYKIKTDYNDNFYVDSKRKSPVSPTKNKKGSYQFLKKIFESSQFIKTINKIYNYKIYQWAYRYNQSSFPFRNLNGLLSIVITIDYLSLNQRYMKNLSYQNNTTKIINYFF